MADNMTGDLDELSSGWADVRISVYETNEAWMRAAAQGLTRMVNGLGQWSRENPGIVKALTVLATATALLLT
eukprot:21473-Eustigmatos_ZCMA.PRE.1